MATTATFYPYFYRLQSGKDVMLDIIVNLMITNIMLPTN